jgi:two-component system C4-dicarboxylate transport sensor histidine kinase DctB
MITCTLRRAGAAIELAIIDDGEGVPPDRLDQIFDPMFTTKPGGSGFGLAVCKAVMEGHGGTLRCVSEPGKGARFIATFPLESPGESR